MSGDLAIFHRSFPFLLFYFEEKILTEGETVVARTERLDDCNCNYVIITFRKNVSSIFFILYGKRKFASVINICIVV